jgi:hypothetical protein
MTSLNTGFILLPSFLIILRPQAMILLIKSSTHAIVFNVGSNVFFEAMPYLFKDKKVFSRLQAKATKINNVGGNKHVEARILYMKRGCIYV